MPQLAQTMGEEDDYYMLQPEAEATPFGIMTGASVPRDLCGLQPEACIHQKLVEQRPVALPFARGGGEKNNGGIFLVGEERNPEASACPQTNSPN